MVYIVRQAYDFLRFYFIDYSDVRSDDLLIANSAVTVLGVVFGYLYLVLSVGPKLMEKREPFKIKNVLIFYNTFQIVANLVVLFYVIKVTYWQGTYTKFCNEASTREDLSELGRSQVNATYAYFLLKILDLLDTVFFLMRKRFTHVTFLHVYHHSAMVVAVAVSVRFLPAGHATMLGILNCIVHCMMYGYYLVSALNENVKRSIWWKKYITQVQMIQFLLLGVHFSIAIFSTECNYPIFIAIVMAIQNLFMLFMFGDFYYRAYLKQKSQ